MLVFILFAGIGVFAATVAAVQEEKHSDPNRSCTSSECHPEIIQHKYLHGPLTLGECTVCHAPLPGNEHKFRYLNSEAKMCVTCHRPVNTGSFPHEPVAEGKCIECHDPHGSEAQAHIRKSSLVELCNDCHDPVANRRRRHEPVERGECLECHSAHGSEEANLLNATGNEFCFQCHEEQNPIGANGKSRKIHLAEEVCADCHRSHDSDYSGLLAEPPLALCFHCHEDLKKEVDSSEFKHEAISEGQACLECHKAHNSTFTPLLRKAETALCFSCHENVKTQVEQAEFKHRPIMDKNCLSCHAPHASSHRKRLFEDAPFATYMAYDPSHYAFCFTCHEETITRDRYTDQFTDFRNGELNLHYLHVNKETKGRACMDCHSGHASDQPKIIRSSRTFGKWESPIKFTKTETGGSCTTGCHEDYKYDRINPEQLNAQ